MTPAITTHGLSKRYRLGGLRPGGLLYEEIGRRLKLRGPESAAEEKQRWVWALRDVSFEAQIGEVVGIVGRNGAGKSTLLRVLSRITEPTEGTAEVRGRLASLLEVGTGFHPELTGRENIFLNGSILGLSKRDIRSRFDEIVEFAEIERFLDTPVKRYSSGMYMRLAFAVAAHLEPDVLVVDEVLAVGDFAFQRKCLGRMEAIAGSGRTVLFVSHNLAAVRSLCTSMLLLEAGRVTFRGTVEEGLERYEARLPVGAGELDPKEFRGPLTNSLRFESIRILQDGTERSHVDPSRPLELRIRGRAEKRLPTLDVTLAFFRDGARLFSCQDGPAGQPMPEGPFESRYELDGGLLRPGHYTLAIGARRAERGDWIWADEAMRLEVGAATDPGFDERDLGALSVTYQGRRTKPSS